MDLLTYKTDLKKQLARTPAQANEIMEKIQEELSPYSTSRNDLHQLQIRLNQCSRMFNVNNKITFEEFTLETNRVMASLIHLIDDLRENEIQVTKNQFDEAFSYSQGWDLSVNWFTSKRINLLRFAVSKLF